MAYHVFLKRQLIQRVQREPTDEHATRLQRRIFVGAIVFGFKFGEVFQGHVSILTKGGYYHYRPYPSRSMTSFVSP